MPIRCTVHCTILLYAFLVWWKLLHLSHLTLFTLGLCLTAISPSAESSSPVCITLRSHEKKCFKKLRSLHHTAESDSGVCFIPRSLAPRCDAHSGVSNLPSVCLIRNVTIVISLWVKLLGVHHTAESSSKVCIIPRCQVQRYASHHGVKLHTTE